MKVTHPIVTPSISEYVRGILVIENYQSTKPFALPLFANGTPTLVFQTAKAQIKNSSNHLTLFGQTVSPDQLFIKGEFTLIAYFLVPSALSALFHIRGNELTDNPVDFNLVIDSDLQERLLNSKTIKQKLSQIDDYIVGLIMKADANDHRCRYATEKISQKPFGSILADVQKDLCITERTFQRWFETNTGISPNQFRRISQFNAAFQQLNTGKFKNLADLAFANGYSDQSHFIRAFKEYTSITPTEYLQLRNAL